MYTMLLDETPDERAFEHYFEFRAGVRMALTVGEFGHGRLLAEHGWNWPVGELPATRVDADYLTVVASGGC